MSKRVDKRLHGEAGEHWVIYKLLRRGEVEDAIQASAGMKDHDLIVQLPGGSWKRLQVKTRTTPGGDGGWWVSKSPAVARDLLYILLDASREGRADRVRRTEQGNRQVRIRDRRHRS